MDMASDEKFRGALRSDGRWWIRLFGEDPRNGLRKRLTLYGRTHDEVVAKARECIETPRHDWVHYTHARRERAAKEIKRHPYVYFIWTPDIPAPMVKVGISFNVKTRMCDLQIGSPVRLAVLGSFRGTRADEGLLHDRYQPDWSHGEWFRLTDQIRSDVERLRKYRGSPISDVLTDQSPLKTRAFRQ